MKVLPTLDNITHFHQHTQSVGSSCEQFYVIVNFHRIAVGWVELLRHHHAPRLRQRCRRIDQKRSQPRVQSALAAQGIDMPTKPRAKPRFAHGCFGGQHGFFHPVFNQVGFCQ